MVRPLAQLQGTGCVAVWDRSECSASAAALVSVEVSMEEYARSALLLTVKDVMRELNLGRSKVESLMKQEGLPVIRFGRAVRVPADELKQWIREYLHRQSA
jgi:excisionase family DNA binding protein